MGKGSNRRNEDTQKVRDNWDLIWGKKDTPKEELKEDLGINPKESGESCKKTTDQ